MEEKVLVKGVFSKFNIISGIFLALSVFGLIGLVTSANSNRSDDIVFGFIYILLGIGGACFFYYLFNKCDITVTDKRVYGQAAFARRVDLPFDKISSVDTCLFNGIGVATSSGRINFLLCQNRDEVFETISQLLRERQGVNQTQETIIRQEMPQSSADELKKYKDLLDSGVITQEEFDAKKKQLLGL